MPVTFLDQMPVPSLRTYSSVSVTLLVCAVYYAHMVVVEIQADKNRNPTVKDAATSLEIHAYGTEIGPVKDTSDASRDIEGFVRAVQGHNGSVLETVESYGGEETVADVLAVLLSETWCVWVMINSAYCALLLFGKSIQVLVFGDLRVSEHQHLKERFWHFVFYKFIFVFGVMNVQTLDEVLVWSAWFLMLGFLHLLCQLSKDRQEYLSFSPSTPALMHGKVLLLQLVILVACSLLTGLCVFIAQYTGVNTVSFMVAECALLGLRALCAVTRYALHLYDSHHAGLWERRAQLVYFNDLVFDMTTLAIDFCHHLHMLVWSNIFLSMASLVICMQLRYLFHELSRRVRRHRNYMRVVRAMDKFPVASDGTLTSENDDCAICWEKMHSARTLPCGHNFHSSCLRSWLEQDTSCPTCRQALGAPPRPAPPTPAERTQPAPPPRPTQPPTTNHFFHFDASRYISWLPSFSVEVTHTQLHSHLRAAAAPGSAQLQGMAGQVHDLFPSLPLDAIVADLRVTHSVQMTIENILEERLPSEADPPPHAPEDAPAPPPPQARPGPGGDAPPPPESDSAPVELVPTPLLENAHEGEGHVSGFRFSKSSSEREHMLRRRKETLLQQARRKFSTRPPETPRPDAAVPPTSAAPPTPPPLRPTVSDAKPTLPHGDAAKSADDATARQCEVSEDAAVHRRELAFRAAQMRRGQD